MLYLVFSLLLLAFILLTKAEIVYELNLINGKDRVVVTVSFFWGLLKIKKDITKLKEENEGKSEKKDDRTELRDKFLHFRQLYKLFQLTKKYLGRRITIKDLKVELEIGTEDACQTALLTGMGWSVVGSSLTVITNTFKTHKIYCNIVPNFSKKILKLDLDCIFTLKIVHIIVVGIKMLIYYLKNKEKFKRTIGGDVSG